MSVREYCARIWKRFPVVVRAVFIGCVVASVGYAPRNALIFGNLKRFPTLPWGVLVMALYLGLFWRYLGGHGWPRSSAEIRRARLRGTLPRGQILKWAVVTGVFATVTLRAMLDIARRLSNRPAQDLTSPEALNKYPFATMLLVLLMISAVAGIVEEVAFRGYTQKPIEERHGPVVAILLVSILFCLAHYRFEARDPWPWLIFTPAYFAVAATLGTLAYLTDSIVIGVFVHGLIDAAALLRYWWLGIPKSVWEAGLDAPFWVECATALVFGLATVWALRKVAVVRASLR